MTSGADTKPMTKKTFEKIDELNEEHKKKILSDCSVEELVNALVKRTNSVEVIEAPCTCGFSIKTYYGEYNRDGPALILVVDKS